MFTFKNMLANTLQLFYPHICIGCGSDLIDKGNLLCLHCIYDLPHTNFAQHPNNVVEKIFTGRLPVRAAYSEFYFSKGQLVQHLVHELKYNNNKAIGLYLGEMMGNSILKSGRFSNIDYIIPLPMYADKEFKRGYNQAEVICNGIMSVTQIPVMAKNVTRQYATETQTRKHRAERWQNVDGSFGIQQPDKLVCKNILLVDDVITTGATLEACAQLVLKIPGATVSFAALAHASK
jgi:ComF family protein